MKQKKMFALVIMLGFFAQQSTAGSITDIYPSGDTLTATMMDNIKAAVNDNDNRISALETAGVPTTGAVSISFKSFTPENENEEQVTACVYRKHISDNYGYFIEVATATNVDCDLVAGIQLPHGVTLSSFSCTIYDNYGGGELQARLAKVGLTTGVRETVYTTLNSVDSTEIQTLSDVGEYVVNNSVYA